MSACHSSCSFACLTFTFSLIFSSSATFSFSANFPKMFFSSSKNTTIVKKDSLFFSASSTISFKMLMALHSNIFMLNSWFDISPNKWHQKWRHKKLRSIVKKAQMTTSLYQSVYFWQLGCRDFISYCFGLAKFKLNSLNLIFSRVFLHCR